MCPPVIQQQPDGDEAAERQQREARQQLRRDARVEQYDGKELQEGEHEVGNDEKLRRPRAVRYVADA